MENKSWRKITKEESDIIYNSEKIIIENIQWYCENNSMRFKSSVYFKNKIESNIKVELLGVKNKKYSFALRCNNNLIIRRWDFKRHAGLINKPHKHFFNLDINSKDIYIVEDIPINDINKAFYCFLEECKIELKGNYQSIL